MSRSRHSPHWDKPTKPGAHKWWKKMMHRRLDRHGPVDEVPTIRKAARGND